MRWEDVEACNFCGSGDSRPFLRLHTSNWYDNRPLTLVKCAHCGLVRATPRPHRSDLYRRYLAGAPNLVALVQKRLNRPNVMSIHTRVVEEAVEAARRPVKKLFDMGCGAGTVMMAAHLMGIQAEGNDVNGVAIRMLDELGFTARLGFTKQLDFGGMKYDAVTSLEYIEQSYEPFDDLKRSHELLYEGGVLYLKTVYLDCPDHQASGETWPMFGAGHFHFFHPETLSAMIRGAGFKIIETRFASTATVIAIREN